MFKKFIVAALAALAIAVQAATLTFVITIPDAQQARAMTALRTHYTTTDAQGNPVVPTQAQAIASFRQSVAAAFKNLVLKVERDAARSTAEAGVTPVDSQ